MSAQTPHWETEQNGLLKQAAQSAKLGLICDMDGTLSPIVAIPSEAKLSLKNRELLEALSPALDLLAIVSGRGVEDLAKRVDIADAILIGNHGMESMVDRETIVAPEASAFQTNLKTLIQKLKHIDEPGVFLEDKGVSASLHYRQVADPETFRRDFWEELAELAKEHGLVFSEGRMVFEFKAPVKITKGTALENLIQEHELDGFFFLGDDTTDISALMACKTIRASKIALGYGIGVQSEEGDPLVVETADFYAEGVEGVEDFLSWLLSACKASST